MKTNKLKRIYKSSVYILFVLLIGLFLGLLFMTDYMTISMSLVTALIILFIIHTISLTKKLKILRFTKKLKLQIVSLTILNFGLLALVVYGSFAVPEFSGILKEQYFRENYVHISNISAYDNHIVKFKYSNLSIDEINLIEKYVIPSIKREYLMKVNDVIFKRDKNDYYIGIALNNKIKVLIYEDPLCKVNFETLCHELLHTINMRHSYVLDGLSDDLNCIDKKYLYELFTRNQDNASNRYRECYFMKEVN